ncbi:YecA family protein [Marinobacterium arenosum]|uniref:YecA family protein n=1 Tax=Marinobacterium arenosum TaxID=2862496 RepID=UPI0036F2D0AD
MLSQIKKQKGQNKSERYLARLADSTFFGLWSYPNVYTDEGFKKNKQGDELCDLLVVFENKVLIFSDKEISFNKEIDVEVAWKRWLKRSVIKSASQLHGAESFIKSNPSRLYLDKKCKQKFPIHLDSSDIEVYLIAVTKNSTTPAINYFNSIDKGSSGTLLHCYYHTMEDCLEKPFVLGDINPNKTFVHVFDELALDLIFSKLDTTYDFIYYLKTKEKAIRSGVLLSIAGEEELLAYYLSNTSKKLVGDIPLPLKNKENALLVLSEGGWERFQSSEYDKFLRSNKTKSQYWDKLISIFSKSILDGTVDPELNLPFKTHEEALKSLASENRVSRGILCEAFLDKFNSVPEEARSSRLVFSPLYPNRLYIFLFFPRYEEIDYKEYRESRRNCMKAYLLVAKYLNPKVDDIVILATETKNSNGRSEDIMSVKFSEPLTQDQKDKAKKIMDEQSVLNQSKKFNSRELSAVQRPYLNMKLKIGRNNPCPCGSGVKYKRCCGN